MHFTVRDHSFSTYAKLVPTCAYQGVRNACFSENFANVLNESCLMSLFLTCFGINVLQLSWRFSPLTMFQRMVHSFYYLNDDMSQIQWTILFLAWTEIWEEIKNYLERTLGINIAILETFNCQLEWNSLISSVIVMVFVGTLVRTA